MAKPWTEALTPARVNFMNEIVAQVPTEGGARSMFISILQDLTDHVPVDPDKFRYAIVQIETGEVVGTNDEERALLYAADDENFVIDMQNRQWLPAADPDEASDLVQAEVLDTDEPEEDDE